MHVGEGKEKQNKVKTEMEANLKRLFTIESKLMVARGEVQGWAKQGMSTGGYM